MIIKRIRKSGHDVHHGGQWKVAYVDFETAMMAFFLLMWLIKVAGKAGSEPLLPKTRRRPRTAASATS